MKLEFTSTEINSFSIGHQVFENNGEPIEIPASQADGFLQAKICLDGKLVPVFKIVASEDAAASEDATASGDAGTDEEVEDAAALVRNHSREELDAIATDLELDPAAYNNKTELATAILEAKGDK